MRRRRFKLKSPEMTAALRAAADAGMTVRVLKIDNMAGSIALEMTPRADPVSEPTPEEHAQERAQIEKALAEFRAKHSGKPARLTRPGVFGKSASTGLIPTLADTVEKTK